VGDTVWTGTQLGYALSGCRLASGNLLLDWNTFVSDSGTLGLWHLNEASWNGTPGEVVDSGPNGYHGVRIGAADTASGLMGRCAYPSYGTTNNGVQGTTTNFFSGVTQACAECWFRIDSNPGAISSIMATRGSAGYNGGWQLYMNTNGTLFWYYYNGGEYDLGPTAGSYADAAIHHVAIVNDATYTILYVDGVNVAQRNRVVWVNYRWCIGYSERDLNDHGWPKWIDEVRVSKVARYTANFSPLFYPASGTGTVNPALAQANCKPGVLTVTLSEALPTGTALKAKLLSTTGGDTGYQTLAGGGTTYTYDFTGAANASWYPSLQLLAGGSLNANTPSVSQASLEWGAPVATWNRNIFRSGVFGNVFGLGGEPA
jgi:hypothetical protein